jgi:hypothetical protein
MQERAFGSAGVCLTPAECEILKQLMAQHGEQKFAVSISLSRTALSRGVAGLPVQPSTARLLRLGIAEHTSK